MNYRIWTPYDKIKPECYKGPRVFASKEEAVARCQELNESLETEGCLVGTFSFRATERPVDAPAMAVEAKAQE